jgi:hypothetical protein
LIDSKPRVGVHAARTSNDSTCWITHVSCVCGSVLHHVHVVSVAHSSNRPTPASAAAPSAGAGAAVPGPSSADASMAPAAAAAPGPVAASAAASAVAPTGKAPSAGKKNAEAKKPPRAQSGGEKIPVQILRHNFKHLKQRFEQRGEVRLHPLLDCFTPSFTRDPPQRPTRSIACLRTAVRAHTHESRQSHTHTHTHTQTFAVARHGWLLLEPTQPQPYAQSNFHAPTN